jgi:hypothetical protein
MPVKNHKSKYLFHKSKRLLRTLAFLILIGSIFAGVSLWLANPTRADWANDAWAFRKKVTLTNPTATVLTNFQSYITLDTASLISAGKLRSDCNDIRVYDSTQVQPQNFWVDACNSAGSRIWMKLSFSANEVKYFYIYYGNPQAASTQIDGSNIFEFFDGFSGSSVDTSKWNIVDATGWSVSNGQLIGTNTSGRITSLPTFGNGYVLETKNRWVTHSTDAFMAAGFYGSGSANFGYLETWNGNPDYYRNNNSWVSLGNGPNSSSNLLTRITVKSPSAVDFYVKNLDNSSVLQNYTDISNSVSGENIALGRRYDEYGLGEAYESDWDWVLVRKYTAAEPTSALSSEEKSQGPSLYWKMDSQNKSPINTIEQQINILNQTYTSYTLNSYLPADNSLGIIHWDASEYPNSTVYFEAEVYMTDGHPWKTSYVSLFDTGGNKVTSSEIVGGADFAWVLERSGAVTLTDNTDYTVRITMGYADSISIRAARLIVVQSNSSKLTQTQSSVEMGTFETQSSSTATQLANPKIYRYDSAEYSPSPTVNFSAVLKADQPPTIEQQVNILDQTYNTTSGTYAPTDNSLGIIHWDASKYPNSTVYLEAEVTLDSGHPWKTSYVSLFDTGGNKVGSSEIVSGPAGFWERQRSGPVTLTDNTDYTVRVAMGYSNSLTIRAARLIIIQSSPTKISDTQSQIEVGNNETTSSTSYANLADKKIYHYDSSKFTPTPTAYFEASLSNDTAGQTAYAALYTDGASCTTQVSGSEVSVTGTSWGRVRSGSISLSSGSDYSVCIKAGADTARIAGAKIILNQSNAGGITATELVHQQINTLTTDTDNSYTTQVYPNRFNPNLESSEVSLSGGNFAYYYEATLKTTAGSAYAQLYNTTSSAAVAGSEITTANTGYTRIRSGDITANMPSYPAYLLAQSLDTQLKNSASSGNTTSASNSWVIIQVTNLSTIGGAPAYADLYNLTDSTVVAGSEVSTSNQAWTLVNSGPLTLASGKNYVVRTKTGINTFPITIAGAKLQLSQSNPNGIFRTETVQDMANSLVTDTDNIYTDQSFQNQYSPGNFTNKNIYFEATIKASAGTAFVQLKNSTDSTVVTGSEAALLGTIYARIRSGDITAFMPTTAKSMDTQIKNSAASGNSTYLTSSRLIIDTNGGDQTYDSSSNHLNGDLSAPDPSLQTSTGCVSNNCFSFNGSNNYVARPYSAILDPGTADFTVSVWFKHPISVSSQNTLISRFGSGGWKVYMNPSGNLCFGIDDGASWTPKDSICSTGSYTDSVWHNLIAVKSGTSSISLYIDGVRSGLDSSLSATGSLSGTSPAFYVGVDSDGASNYWNGSVDEVKYYNFAKPASEISASYAAVALSKNINANLGSAGKSALTNGLIGYWKMDGDSTDSSGNGYTLANNGSVPYSAGKFGNGAGIFDGSSKYFSTAVTIPGIQTVSFWAYPANTSNNYVNFASGINLTSSLGNIAAAGFTNPQIYINGVQSGTVSANTWQLITVTSSQPISADTFRIGQASGAYYSNNSLIDDIRIYNRALSSSEVAQLYNWAPGPIGYWKFDDGSGSTVNDSSGNNFTGIWSGTGTSHWTTGKYDQAGNFNGSDDVVTVGDISSKLNLISTTPPSFTISGWFNSASENNSTSGIALINNNARLFYNSASGGIFSFQLISSSTQALTNTIIPNTWYYVTGTYDKNTNLISIYLNGVLRDSKTPASTDLSGSAMNMTIGNAQFYYKGQLDDIKVYNYARSPSQVIEDMNAGHPAPGSPIGSSYIYYKFNEATGTAADNSGNGGSSVNGTVTNGTWTLSGKFAGALTFGASTAVTSTISDPGNTNTISLWLNPITSVASKTLVTNLTTNGSSAPVYGGCTGTAIPLNQWSHLVAVSNGSGSCTIYQNGVMTGSGTTGVSFGTTLNIGNSGFTGTMDEFKLYAEALTADQVKEEYNRGSSQVLGSLSTTSAGTPDNSAAGAYCPPGSADACSPPVGEWKFDENTGTAAVDSSGKNNNGTLTGSAVPLWKIGRLGSALAFNGTNSYVGAGNDSSLQITGNMTLSAWVNLTDNSAVHDIVARNGTSGNYNYRLYTSAAGKLVMEVSSNGTAVASVTGGTTLSAGSWYHVEGVYIPGTSLTVYVNGIPDSQNTTSIPASINNASSVPLNIGGENGGTSGNAAAFVQECHNSGGTSITSLQINCATTLGNLLVVMFQANSGSSRTYTVTDSNGDTFTKCTNCEFRPSGYSNTGELFYYLTTTANTSVTINVASGAGTSITGSVEEFSGISASPFDQSSGNGCDTGCSSLTSNATSATSQANEVAVGHLGVEGNAAPTGAGSGWNYNSTFFYGSSIGVLSGYKILSSTGAQTNSGTQSGSELWTASVATFKSNSGGSSPATNVMSGLIDQVRIYNYARTPAQVAWDYNRGSPIAQYEFNECAGSALHDTASKSDPRNFTAYNGTITPNAGRTTGTCGSGVSTEMWNGGTSGKYSASLAFDGSGDYVATANTALIAPNANTYTKISWGAWINPSSSPASKTIIHKNNEFRLTTDGSGNPQCAIFSASWQTAATSTSALPISAWSHVVCTYDGSYVRLYVNGIQTAYQSQSGNITSGNSTALDIARDSAGSGYFAGQLDDVRIYNYALTPAQVQTLYNGGVAVKF